MDLVLLVAFSSLAAPALGKGLFNQTFSVFKLSTAAPRFCRHELLRAKQADVSV